MFELVNIAFKKDVINKIGNYMLCAVDGEDDDRVNQGVRSAELEVAMACASFSSDPADFHVISGKYGTRKLLRTSVLPKVNKAAIINQRRVKARAKLAEIEKKKRKGENIDYSALDEEEDEDDLSSSDSDSDAELKIEVNRDVLAKCRLLHIAANKVPLDMQRHAAKGASPSLASLYVPKSAKAKKYFEIKQSKATKRTISKAKEQLNKKYDNKTVDDGNTLSGKDIVAQLYLKNCALCMLSRFAITDDVVDVKPSADGNLGNCESNVEFIDSLHLAGACTVIYPLWSPISQGVIGILASQLFLIRFYVELPLLSRSKRSIIEAVRRTQLWLRDLTGDDAVKFLNNIPLPKAGRKTILNELDELFIAANVTNAINEHAGMTIHLLTHSCLYSHTYLYSLRRCEAG